MYPRPDVRLSISGGFLLLICWFALANGAGLTAIVLLAAAIHEGGHLLLLRRNGGRVSAFRLSLFGAVIESAGSRLSYGGELAAVLAGPAANLLCGLLLAAAGRVCELPVLYLAAGANLLLGCFNLLPICPLDGGRALELLVSWRWGPDVGEHCAAWCAGIFGLICGGTLVGMMAATKGSLWLAPAAAGLLMVAGSSIFHTKRR